jgi:hypothetical protein
MVGRGISAPDPSRTTTGTPAFTAPDCAHTGDGRIETKDNASTQTVRRETHDDDMALLW